MLLRSVSPLMLLIPPVDPPVPPSLLQALLTSQSLIVIDFQTAWFIVGRVTDPS